MATQPFRFGGKTVEEMSPEELEEARQFLREASAGYSGLVEGRPFGEQVVPEETQRWQGITGAPGLMPGAGVGSLREPERDPLQAALTSIEGGAFRDIGELRRRQLGGVASVPPAAAPPSMTWEQALMEGGHGPAEPPAPPVAGQAPPAAEEEQYRTVIGSRRDPTTGRIIFETQRVKAADVPVDIGSFPTQGAQEWQRGALAENAQRAAATAAFQRTHPLRVTYDPATGDPFKGFQVRAGQGGFSPSRTAEDVLGRFGAKSVADLSEEQLQQESPAVQQVMREAQDNALARRAREAAIADVEAKRGLAAAQAAREEALGGIAQEQLKEVQDPVLRVQRQLAEYNALRETLRPEVAQAVETEVASTVATLTKAGYSPNDAMVADIRRRALEKHTGTSYANLIRDLQMLTPGGYAATIRSQGSY